MSRSVILSFLVFLVTGCLAELEILDLFGNILLEAGIPLNVTCRVTGEQPGKSLIWVVGDRFLAESDRLQSVGEDIFQSTLVYLPEIRDDQQSLICRYGSSQTSLEVRTFTQDIFFTSRLHKADTEEDEEEDDVYDGSWEVVAKARLHPAPTSRDILWTVEPRTGGRVLLRPGGREDFYHAGDIEVKDDHFVFRLELDQVVESNVSLTINTKEKVKTVYFQMEREALLTPREYPSSLPWYIWLAIAGVVIVFLIIIGVIVLILYRRTKTKKTEEDDPGKIFTSYLGNIYIRTAQEENPRS